MRRFTCAAGAGLILTACLLAFTSAASADVPVLNFGIKPNTTSAGSHPDLQISFYLNEQKHQQNAEEITEECGCANPRTVTIHAPAGLVGNPHSTPRCNAVAFGSNTCPTDSQIGLVQVMLAYTPEGHLGVVAPLYNLVPRGGEPGLVGFQVLGNTTFEKISTRTGSDYGLDTTVYLWGGIAPSLVNQIYFGVPAAPSNDRLRFKFPGIVALFANVCDGDGNAVSPNFAVGIGGEPLGALSGPDSFQKSCEGFQTGDFNGQTPTGSSSPELPFLEAPTTCGVPLESTIDVAAYDGGQTHSAASYPSTTGCDQLQFNPSLAASPTTSEADSPSGLEVDLTVPQAESPTTPAQSEIRSATVTLPEGFTVNANAADGKTACQDSEARFGTEEQAKCPELAKIGTLEVRTALLPGPLPGYVYLGQPLPGERYRVFLTADGFSVHIKLPGTLRIDRATGQATVTFENLPQTPFEEFRMHIFGSERGSLATPVRCGTYPVHSTFVPWDSALPDQSSTQFFAIDSGPGGTPCPGQTRPFAPGFSASSAGNTAGAHTPFSVDLTRSDGDQNLAGLTVRTPPGFAATLKGVPYCPDPAIEQMQSAAYSGLAELAHPACPAGSQIGTAVAGVGAGSRPLYVTGKVYLAGPYKGQPLSLLAVVPAVSGPYDLGNVAVRAAIHVDPVTAQVTTISDPLPQIIEGIPLRIRAIQIRLDRPNFTLNPTNCDPTAVHGQALGDEGGAADLSSFYQMSNCASLPYMPKLQMRLTGGLNRRGHPAIHSTFTAKPGEANTQSVSVAMPAGELLDNAHISTPCTRVQYAAGICPTSSMIGSAVAETSLLGKPLEGPVYLRSSSHDLPDIVVDLKGQFNIELAARIDTDPRTGGLRATFETVPDAPVTRFTLNLAGGKRGLLQNSKSLCARPNYATTRLVGQNGARRGLRTRLGVNCGSKGRRR